MRDLPRWLSPLILLLLGMSACIGSPQPSPPNLDPEGVAVEMPGTTDVFEGARVVGAPGSVEPAEGSVAATPLDTEDPVAAELVRADGSFEVFLPTVRLGHEVRVQIRNGGARSVPLDVVLADEAIRLPGRDPCVVVDLEADAQYVPVGTAGVLNVELASTCPNDRMLSTRLRTDGPFRVLAAPDVLRAGQTAEIQLEVVPTEPGTAEQTLFVVAGVDRHPVTLFVTGTP